MPRRFKAGEAENGLRVDVFLANKLSDFSRSSLEKLFGSGAVVVGGKKIKPSYKMLAGDKVEVDEKLLKQKTPKIDLPIIYEDENVIVINKPAGTLTHSKGGFNNEATVATFIAPKLSKELVGNRAGIIHRLDRATSGVIICARNATAQKLLQKQFAQRKVKKIYLAVAEGKVEPAEAVIDAPIERNPKKPQTFRVSKAGKPAQTRYKVLKKPALGGSSVLQSVLELRPTTGRTHQLRVHLKYINHPIVGDGLYGKAGEHMLLHAKSLELTLPGSERKVFTADAPEYFDAYV